MNLYSLMSHFIQFLKFSSYLVKVFMIMLKKGWRRTDCVNFNVHTFGIPNHGCPRDILDESLTNGRCSGSEMHGCTYPKPRYILLMSQRPDLPGTQYKDP